MCGPSNDTYVADYRQVLTHENKRYRFPKNYDNIVETGRIKSDGTDSEGKLQLKLLYGKKDKKGLVPCYTIVEVLTYQKSDYFYCTPYLTACINENDLHASCYEPFGFSKMEIKKFLPLFELLRTGDADNPYKLVNTKYVAKIGQSEVRFEEESVSDGEKKGRNGKLAYKAHYGKRNTTFYVIRDHSGKLELDKTIITFPVVLMSSLIKLCALILAYLPMKLGECLISTQNPVAKFFGCIFFVPFMAIKFGVDLGAIVGKTPILLFVADQKKYSDSYWTLWKHEFFRCLNDVKSDVILIIDGKRPEEFDLEEVGTGAACGTWNELNALKRKFYSAPSMIKGDDNIV